MERGEHFKEAKASLLLGLGACNDLGVPRRVKAVLHLVELQRAILVGIKLVESLEDKALSKWVQLAAEGREELIEADLTVTTGVEHVEEALCIAGAHPWHSKAVKDRLEFAHAELAGTVSIHDGKLFLEVD